MPFNAQSTSKFAVLEFGTGTQPKQTSVPKKVKAAASTKTEEKPLKTVADSEGDGKVIENLILSTLSTDGECISFILHGRYVDVI